MGGELSKRDRMVTPPANANNSQKQEQALQQPYPWTSVDHPVTSATQASPRIMDILKPYLLLACVAFTIGFVGYWAMGRALTPAYAAPMDDYRGAIATSAPDPTLADGIHI
jgi:hypothetical protein